MATYKVSPATAKRVIGMIEHHAGDLSAARYDVALVLRSLGGYTDRKSEAVLEALDWLSRQSPERHPLLIATFRQIAGGSIVNPSN